MAKLTSQKLEAIRSEYKQRRISGKYPRQKMLPEYTNIYPWVLADEMDPYFAFCTICECRLSAKRSDLGKHEGSIKHKENAARKRNGIKKDRDELEDTYSDQQMDDLKYDPMLLQASTIRSHNAEDDNDNDNDDNDDDNDDDDDDEPYIKHEPVIDLVENSSGMLNLEPNTDSEMEEDGDPEDDNYEDESTSYISALKRCASETDSQSQHSSTLDYLPVQVTISEANAVQRFSIREITPSCAYTTTTTITPSMNNSTTSTSTSSVAALGYTPQSAAATLPASASAAASVPQNTACKITIKKITAPMPPTAPAQVTSTATITPVPSSIRISQQPQPQPQQQQLAGSMAGAQQPQPLAAHSTAQVCPSTQPTAPRDSFDMFFESICASVKALPPKLATEGKIRVMQLIGELEMRAITQREEERAHSTAQQNATSTTK